jgi:hypothetical protein
VAAFGVVEASLDAIAELRKNPGRWARGTESVGSHLKLVDEQAVLATAAVLRAIEQANWHERSFANWGILSAPCFFGRVRGSAVIQRYLRLGARAMPPLAIPTLSLHSISGTLSQILQATGPNFGLSGERTHISEALLTALVVPQFHGVAGFWVVLTGWEPEPIPEENGRPRNPITGYGVALALVESASAWGATLQYKPADSEEPANITSIREVANFLQTSAPGESWGCPVLGGGRVVIRRSSEVQRQVA